MLNWILVLNFHQRVYKKDKPSRNYEPSFELNKYIAKEKLKEQNNCIS